ncbi:MAG: alkylhydroperoxidase [Rhizobiales bacterium]|nr:alkylhydroperoxidase [Hyphomicrobiales bacterium]|tara:strand:+ start:141 stop:596 length:456 start_codon:yes stop_codon:yes gene_type:complete
MKPRLNYFETEPKIMTAVAELSSAVDTCGLEAGLLHLVKLRASQINGCSYCVEMHTREARADGETEQRLYLVSAWRESPLFSARERAALAWTEALTRIADGGVTDHLYDEVAREFDAPDLTRLTVAVSMINTWNRIAISSRMIHPVKRAAA